MNKTILVIMIFSPAILFSQNDDKMKFDKTSINGQYGYNVRSNRGEFKGLLTLKYIGNSSLRFKIIIDESRGQYGEIEGIAKLNDARNAIFKNENCEELVFKLSKDSIQINETNCDYYHGANTSFTGNYYRPILKSRVQ